MRFEIPRDALLKPLLAISGVVEKRQTLPILANVLIQLENNRATFTGTDLEIQLTTDIQLEKSVDEPMELTLPARKLTDICRNLPEGSLITFSIEKNRTVVRSGKSRFSLTQLIPQDFPSMDSITAVTEFSMTQGKLRKLLEKTHFCMANQDVRYYLNGMLWEVSGSKLNGVATDGHRLAISTIDLPGESSSPTRQVILPRKGVVELSRLMADEGDITISLGDAHLRVRGSDFHFTSKLVDGAYPDYDRVLPKGGTLEVRGDRNDLRQAFSRAAILSNEKYRGVRLLLSENLLNIVANNPEQEEAQEEVTVSYTGTELEVGFNVNYILDVLNTLSSEEVVFILSDANSSALIQDPADQEGSSYVIMPMRL